MPGNADGGRRCRVCGEAYAYPERGSAATRQHCGHCVKLEPETRRALEALRRRLDHLARAVEGPGPER
ncbi:MAG: hypothetical protein WDA75_06615 [Candidatus Latescibacterota bacterium]